MRRKKFSDMTTFEILGVLVEASDSHQSADTDSQKDEIIVELDAFTLILNRDGTYEVEAVIN